MKDLKKYFETGVTLDVSWRRTQLQALIRMVEENEDALARALHQDLGKTPQEAWLTEIGFVVHEARFVLRHLARWTKKRRVRTPAFLCPASSGVRPMPRGEVLIISPWNYPIQLTLSPLVAALAAGNVVVIKPSEYAPATSEWLARSLPRYLDAQAVEVVQGGPDETSALLKRPFDLIFFTGSVQTARHIARAAAEHLTPTVLELGGKSPCVVAHTQHLRTAARRIAFAKFTNAGQTCVAPDYLLVEPTLKTAFVEHLTQAIVEMFGPENAPVRMARIVNRRHFDRLSALLGHGESVMFGGHRDADALLIAPTLMSVEPSHPVMREEIFGPLLPILELDSTDPIADALRRISDHPSPLAAYLFSDEAADLRAFDGLLCGGFAHNDALMHLANVHLPFGGVATSGHGASHGFAGFHAFSHWRAELDQSAVVDPDLRYPPYSGRDLRTLKWLM